MRVIVCGGRNFQDVALLWRTLDEISERQIISCIIDGASDDVTGPYQGADYWAHQWARARGRPTMRVFADWKKHGRAAGPIRNSEMLKDGQPNLVVAFVGGNGTADMVRKARAASVEVTEVRA